MPSYRLDIIVNGKDHASGILHGFGGAIAGLGKTALLAATGGLVALTTALGSSVGAAMDFESTLSGVRAVLSPTGAEFEALSAKALQLGKDTNFGASEAATAIEELAKNGLNATQILDGAADAAVNLASATGLKGREGLASAATIATDTMAAFGIQAKDMARAINGIAGVTVASKFGIDDYRLALAQAGGVAGSVGVEFEDFNTAITAISSLFASGSDAGTSFKTMLQRLVPVSGPAAEAMMRLGIITEDGANKFFDANGQMRSMAEIAGVLQEAMKGLSEAQAIDLFTTAFGTDAQRAAFGLARTGANDFRALAASIAKVDAAAQAATRLDNLAGDVEQLKGSLETARIEMGTAFTPLLRDLTQAATEFVNANLIGRDWTPFVSGVERGIGAITGLVGAIQAAGGPADFLHQQLDQLAGQAVVWGQTLLGQAEETALGWAATLGQWAAAAIPELLTNLDTYAQTARTWALGQVPIWTESLRGWGQAAAQWALDTIPGLLVNLFELRTQLIGWALGQVPGLIEAVRPWGNALLQWIVDSTPGMLRELGRLTGDLVDTIGAAIPGIVEALAPWGAELVAWVTKAAPGLFRELLTLNSELLTWIGERIPGIAGQLGEWAIEFVKWVGPATADLIIALGHMFGDLLTWIVDGAPGLSDQLGTWTQTFVDWALTKLGPALLEALKGLGDRLWTEATSLWGQAFAEGSRGEALLNSLGLGGGAPPPVPGFASGVRNFRGGLAVVGENGPELLNLPGGSDVVPMRGLSAPFGLASGGGGGSFVWTGDLIIQEASNPRETARLVREELIKLGKRNNGLNGIFGGFA